MKKVYLFFLVFALFNCYQISYGNDWQKKDESVEGLSKAKLELAVKNVKKYVDEGKLAGINVMVVKNGKTLVSESFGYYDLENKKPMSNKTMFRAYSMTKPVTAAALMMLFDKGKFKLDDEVSKYIPEFANTEVYNAETKKLEPQKKQMTIRNLLTHTAGLSYGFGMSPYVDSCYKAASVNGWGNLEQQVKKIAQQPLSYQPGTKWEYSYAIDVAGYLVELFSGMPLDEYFKTQIFEPLGMDDSGFYVPENKHSSFALVYGKNMMGTLQGPDNPNEDSFLKPTKLLQGGAGMVTTIDDYSKFAAMLVNGGELNGVRLLKESTTELIMSNNLPKGVVFNGLGPSNRPVGGYGLGGSYDVKTGDYGWTGAASTYLRIDPRNNMFILGFTQLMPIDCSYANEFSDDIHDAFIKE